MLQNVNLIVGAEVKAGTFNKDGKDITYNNIVLTCLCPYDEKATQNSHYGLGTVQYKVKNDSDSFYRIFGTNDTKELLGQSYEFYFNQWGALAHANKVEAKVATDTIKAVSQTFKM